MPEPQHQLDRLAICMHTKRGQRLAHCSQYYIFFLLLLLKAPVKVSKPVPTLTNLDNWLRAVGQLVAELRKEEQQKQLGGGGSTLALSDGELDEVEGLLYRIIWQQWPKLSDVQSKHRSIHVCFAGHHRISPDVPKYRWVPASDRGSEPPDAGRAHPMASLQLPGSAIVVSAHVDGAVDVSFPGGSCWPWSKAPSGVLEVAQLTVSGLGLKTTNREPQRPLM